MATTKKPAFLFYVKDWRNNAKLRRCSPAARGVWVDVLCLMHDSDAEYGALRWPLKDIIQASGAAAAHVRELVEKGVLKGSDKAGMQYLFTPKHAGKAGPAVLLLDAPDGPIWYSSRMVRDEWIRKQRGKTSRFDDDNQPSRPPPKHPPNPPPDRSPKGGFGEGSGDGLAFAFAITTEEYTQGGGGVDNFSKPPQGAAYAALRNAGIADANPGDPVLKTLVEQGVLPEEFVAAAEVAKRAGRFDMAYVVGIVRRKRNDAAGLRVGPPVAADDDSPKGLADAPQRVVRAKGRELGLGDWDELTEAWHAYRAKVIAAATATQTEAA